ncbi:hypothetical protein BJ684DRAFT_21761 [Piptocephalis cylindrospora]|uniref:Uncharacterized protein n=1 Tax=Piptocephalis cylindrospora TaxID=1907219 RepID=A0A4P9XZ15_9FUNG|nr:hypothetical protein BJ684DRAFT_21761 [Piptocephalis cylindrospora]|eukprot:RKP11657.1 hypothetical protein BJ684DRAFT_21761 [Piptocephalis cylindrospora]
MEGPGDAFGIRKDLRISSLIIIPLYLFYLALSFWKSRTMPYSLSTSLFLALIALVSHVFAILIPAIRSYRATPSSTWPCPAGVRSTATFTSKTDFHTALLRPERFLELKRIAAIHFSAETTAFLDDLQDLERDYTRTTPDQSMYIFRQYIMPGSIMEIKISDRAREETSHMISMGLCGISVFGEARVEIEELVCLNFYPKLHSSV